MYASRSIVRPFDNRQLARDETLALLQLSDQLTSEKPASVKLITATIRSLNEESTFFNFDDPTLPYSSRAGSLLPPAYVRAYTISLQATQAADSLVSEKTSLAIIPLKIECKTSSSKEDSAAQPRFIEGAKRLELTVYQTPMKLILVDDSIWKEWFADGTVALRVITLDVAGHTEMGRIDLDLIDSRWSSAVIQLKVRNGKPILR